MDEPLPFDIESVTLDASLSLPELLRSVERQIAGAPVEVGFAFDQSGNLLTARVGEVGSLRFYADDMRGMRDAVLTHNHPGNGFFSFADIAFACYVNLWEIRAVAGDAFTDCHALLPVGILTYSRQFLKADAERFCIVISSVTSIVAKLTLE